VAGTATTTSSAPIARSAACSERSAPFARGRDARRVDEDERALAQRRGAGAGGRGVRGDLHRNAGGREQQRELGARVGRAEREAGDGQAARGGVRAGEVADEVRLAGAAGADEGDDAAGRGGDRRDRDVAGEGARDERLEQPPPAAREGQDVGDRLLEHRVGERRVEAVGDERVAQRLGLVGPGRRGRGRGGRARHGDGQRRLVLDARERGHGVGDDRPHLGRRGGRQRLGGPVAPRVVVDDLRQLERLERRGLRRGVGREPAALREEGAQPVVAGVVRSKGV
jgi:hypothetical protein